MSTNSLSLPAPAALLRLIVAGVAAFIAWEIYSKWGLQLVFGKGLDPSKLIINVLGLPKDQTTLAFLLHAVTGIVSFPIAFYILKRITGLGVLSAGLAIGIATWFFAVGIATPIAGGPFLGAFKSWVWKSLAGHLLYGLVLSAVFGERK